MPDVDWNLCRKYGFDRAVFSPLDAADKISAVRAMARIIGEAKGFDRNHIENTARALLCREFLGSTGLGGGLACPHTRDPWESEPHVGWFVANPPIDFEDLDDEPVVLIFCLLSPQNQPGKHLLLMELISELSKDVRLIAIAHLGIERVKAYLDHRFGSGHVQAVEAELAGIGVGLDDLADEVARFRCTVSCAGWDGCLTEMARVEAVLEHLASRLARVGAVAAKEGAIRLADFRRRLKELAAHAKKGKLLSAIWHATSDELSSVDVQVSGPEVSIRAEATTKEQGQHLRSTIASLGELSGYRTEIFIKDGVIRRDAVEEFLTSAPPLRSYTDPDNGTDGQIGTGV